MVEVKDKDLRLKAIELLRILDNNLSVRYLDLFSKVDVKTEDEIDSSPKLYYLSMSLEDDVKYYDGELIFYLNNISKDISLPKDIRSKYNLQDTLTNRFIYCVLSAFGRAKYLKKLMDNDEYNFKYNGSARKRSSTIFIKNNYLQILKVLGELDTKYITYLN